MKNAYVIMSRIPLSGKTKTRLMPFLSGDECASLHTAFLKDLFNMSYELKDCSDIYLTYLNDGNVEDLIHIAPSFIDFYPQKGKSLGEKMNNSIKFLLNKGYEKVVLTGCDIPTLNSEIIKNAFKVLDSKDIVIGPTFDGGYYLIGCKNFIDDVLLCPIRWSNFDVFENTLQIIKNNNKNYGIVEKISDIDTFEDLLYFKSTATKDSNTLSFVEKFKVEERIIYENRV
ncbi:MULTISPECIES: TIGR04282 family arsenosugar biosynthesis glycosyltransferase [Clostridium]|uniref:Glycosyltransferase n=1 Tax=Clostridium senegalense TaxID=1465809 RepID=A0A6M0H7L4_9CLOT|nr:MULTISPECIES: TIGR04282 family arsenosugar biosynthesis glycosyltransferase [Clostridium]NEU06294.1 glycosyltransferase [Clostridium senegalense]